MRPTLAPPALLACALSVLLLASCAGNEREEIVPLDRVPPAARDAIQRHLNGATLKAIEAETENGRTVYEVEADRDGKPVEFEVSADGELLAADDD